MEKFTILDQIDKLERLSFDDAKELYIKSKEFSSDERIKKLYMDKIILGTLYVVEDYIKTNKLDLFENAEFDIDDIRSTLTEIWIRKINDGYLERSFNFYNVFSSDINVEIPNILTNIDTSDSHLDGYNRNSFINMFLAYIKARNEGRKFTFDDAFNNLGENHSYKFAESFYNNRHIYIKTIALFESIYNNLGFDKMKEVNLNKSNITNLYRLLFNIGLRSDLDDKLLVEDQTEEVVKTESNKKIYNIINDCLSIEEKEILILRCGLHENKEEFMTKKEADGFKERIIDRFNITNGGGKSLEDISSYYGVKKDRIRQRECKALRKIRTRCYNEKMILNDGTIDYK